MILQVQRCQLLLVQFGECLPDDGDVINVFDDLSVFDLVQDGAIGVRETRLLI